MAARAQAGVHVHRRVVSIIVLGVDGAGVSGGPGREVLATIQMVYRGGAAGRQGTVRNYHVLWCVVDPLLLRQTGWRCRGQSAATVYTAVRLSRLACGCCHYQTAVLWFVSWSRCGQGGTCGAVTEGHSAGHRRVAVGNQVEWPSCGVGGCRGVGELYSGIEGNDFGRARQHGIRDD